MKRYEALLAAALVLPFGGCIKRVCAILPVPPADSRSRMYDLPLDKQDDLVADLTAGLNPNRCTMRSLKFSKPSLPGFWRMVSSTRS